MNLAKSRFEKAMSVTVEKHQSGASIEETTAAARKILAESGLFGKKIDHDTRRLVAKVTGVELDPGQGHGTKNADGSISYRG